MACGQATRHQDGTHCAQCRGLVPPSAGTGPRTPVMAIRQRSLPGPLHRMSREATRWSARPRLARSTDAPDGQIGWTCSAWGPLAPWLAVNSTRWLSWRLR
jgi:hypothetical protein